MRARVLWRGGDPRCDELARALFGAGVTAFDATAVKVIEAHADACPICSQARSLATSPEALFAAMPLLAVPPGVREGVAAALQGAGVPLDLGGATGAATDGGTAGGAGGTDGGAVGTGGDLGGAVEAGQAPGGELGGAVDPGPGPSPGAEAGGAVGDVGAVPGTDAGALVGPDPLPGGETGPAWPAGDPTVAMAAVEGPGAPAPTTTPIEGPPDPGDPLPGAPKRGRRAALAGGLVALVALVGLGSWLLLREETGGDALTLVDASELEALVSTTTAPPTTPPPTTTTVPPTTLPPTTSPPTTTTPPTTPPTTRPPTTATVPPTTTPPPTSPPPSAPPTVDRFSATRLPLGTPECQQTYESGYRLTWATSGADQVSISGPGVSASAPASGQRVVCLLPPASTPTWTLVATGPGGTAQSTAP